MVFEDALQHAVMEKNIFERALQPFGPVNIINNLYEHTGNFEDCSVTTLVSLDTEEMDLIHKVDEKALEVQLDGLSDQIIEFGFGDRIPLCKLSRPYLPQLGLSFTKQINEHFQPPYWRRLQKPLRQLIEKLAGSQTQHELR